MPRRDERPNVLVIMCDELKATALGIYGNRVLSTPSLERLASEGLCYRYAFTPHPLCVPARVAFWTGQYPHATGARTNQTFLPPGIPHLARCWWEAGYVTALAGKNHCFTVDDERQFQALGDGWGQAPGRPADPAVAAARAARPAHGFVRPSDSWAAPYAPEHSGTWQITDRAIEFLEARAAEGAAGTPWALWVSYPDPHPPFQAPEQYARRFPPERVDLPPWRDDELVDKPQRQRVFFRLMGLRDEPEEAVRRAIGTYYAMVAQIDDCIGRLLDALQRLGLRERTIVVFTSDHGDLMGEHAMMEKGGMLYDALVRVPLLLSWPGHLPSGRMVEHALASLIDVMPTLLWLQGLPIPRTVHGRPLAGIPVGQFGLPELEPAWRWRARAEARGFRPRQRPRGTAPETGEPPISFAEPIWIEQRVLEAGRQAVFAEYGAGGPPVTLADVERCGIPAGRRPVQTLLLEREAEGRPKMVRTHDWKYVYDPLDPEGVAELYDLRSDPWELTNLATSTDPRHQAARHALERLLLDWSLCTEDGRPVPFAFARTETVS